VGKVTAESPVLQAPEPLGARHDASRFSNGLHASLNSWLGKWARVSEGLSASTYVVCAKSDPSRVIGYFSISTALEQRRILPVAKLRKGRPDKIPLLLIGRLAVDEDWRGRGAARLCWRMLSSDV
jgi:hypothetical protein